MSDHTPSFSVVIRSLNEAEGIGRALDLVAGQDFAGPVELIVVDSGSTDGTLGIVQSHGAQLIQILPKDFTYGGALNRGCELASNELIVALSAHAFLPDPEWLSRLAERFDDPRVACASGQDRTPEGSDLVGAIEQEAALARTSPAWGYSNAAGGFRAELWRERHFRADMPATEDKEWALHWLERGRVCVLARDLVVDHDHSKDGMADQFRRARREMLGTALMTRAPRLLSPRELASRWWTDRETYVSSARARLSHRRAARLLGELAGARATRRADLRDPGAADVRRLCVSTDRFPVPSETFVVNEVEELRRQGHAVMVEATDGPRPAPGLDRTASYLVDDSRSRKLLDLSRLVARHPVRVVRDIRRRGAWTREEEVRPLRALACRAARLQRAGVEHIHVHFAAGAALDSLRLGEVLGIPCSVTAHAYEIFASPANLAEKLERAKFATTGCAYNVAHLRTLVSGSARDRIHEVVMGVEPGFFRRTTAYPGGRHVVAVGRLIEKKGFDDLIQAVALLEETSPIKRLTIVGDGPLRAELEEAARRFGVAEKVELPGAESPEEIRGRLQAADVLAMPCVIASDGDRDSMPVVVKEALAMEVPVVATDEVGLPEIVRPEWGRLAKPRDPASLAAALADLLAVPTSERAAMGVAGRRFVLEACNVATETRKLTALIRPAAVG